MTPALKSLADCQVGLRAKIRSIDVPPAARQRLLEMGLTLGSQIEVVRFAPLGDPVEIRVRGYHLSLRKAEAASISVQPL
jgi:Fe2+ transport system protein FeoA